MFPFDFPAAELENGGAQQHYEDDQRDSRAIAQIEGAETQFVSVEGERAGAEAWAGNEEECLKHLHRTDDAYDHLVDEYRADQW